METGIVAPKRKRWPKKVLKIAWIGAVSLASLYCVGRLAWRFSGSNQWELVGDKNGVKVYSLKEPGNDLLQVKGVVRVRSTLASLVKMSQDESFCKETGCLDSRVLDWVDDQVQYGYFRYDLPFPWRPREFVVRTWTYQNPRTKEVLMKVSAVPGMLPPNPCCFRVTDMNNTIRFTPVGNGQVEVEYVQHLNEGGFIPDWLLNVARGRLMLSGLPQLQHIVDRDKYQNAKFDFIKEYEDEFSQGFASTKQTTKNH